MATFYELPLANDFPYFVVDSSGASVPASGYQLFLYATGTTTKITSYTDSTGGTLNANPILLGSTGLPQSGGNVVGIWLAQGQTVKAVFAPSTDTDPPSSPIWTRDFGANPPGINDPTNITASEEWIQGTTPTFISSTSFSVVGDQRTIYHVGRRLKSINSGGAIYSRIISSSFGSSITTVTVVSDSSTLDSGLSSVSYGINSATNTSIPSIISPSSLVTGRATADQSITSQAALQVATNMSVNMLPNEEWVVDCFWDVGGTLSTTGVDIGLTASTASALNLSAALTGDYNGGVNANAFAGRTTSNSTAIKFTAANLTGSSNGLLIASAWVLNGSSAGLLQMNICQDTSSGTALILRKGSHMIAYRVA